MDNKNGQDDRMPDPTGHGLVGRKPWVAPIIESLDGAGAEAGVGMTQESYGFLGTYICPRGSVYATTQLYLGASQCPNS
jgi:hypothetical protein